MRALPAPYGILDHVLVRVLRTFLRPYRRWLSYVTGLQLISTLAAMNTTVQVA